MIAPTQDPPLRVISLHDLNYCQRLFYLTEVEGLERIAIFRGRIALATMQRQSMLACLTSLILQELYYSPITVTTRVRSRGRTSHSNRMICCQVPSTS